MTYRWELGHDGASASLKGVATKYDPHGDFSVAYAEKLPWGGVQYTISMFGFGEDHDWHKVANLEEAKALIIATLILQGVIEP